MGVVWEGVYNEQECETNKREMVEQVGPGDKDWRVDGLGRQDYF